MLEKMERVKTLSHRRTIRFSFPQPVRSGKLVAQLSGVHKAYGPVKVYAGVDLSIFREDKVALVGPNGARKSTLLKRLAGVLKPDEGTIEWGPNVATAYFAQHQLELLDPSQTVWEEIFSLAKDESLSFLRGLLGTFFFITQDRHLINTVANKVIEVRAGSLNVYPGDYQDYLYQKELEKKEAGMETGEAFTPLSSEARRSPSRKSKEQKRIEAEARNRLYRET